MVRFIWICLIGFVIGCGVNVQYTTKGKSTREVHKKFTTEEGEFSTQEQPENVSYMVTSYYGKKFHGKPTSNGETFDMNELTGAHKTLPFGTRLRVTNEDNSKSVVIRINDRGPFVKGRELDISYAAAQEIGLIAYGVKKLKVEILPNE
ncbi:MAG: septal ring lytic transglycosylase RlpA family protein [Candidatus Cloacimonadales bacterium]|nr:septal ring lytic transglycosylase RlpA family protein [Candidatus Cloacimonadales bacterium]